MLLLTLSPLFAQSQDSAKAEIDSMLVRLEMDSGFADTSLHQTVLCLEGWEAKIVASELIKSELKDTIITKLRDLDARNQERIAERDSLLLTKDAIIYQDSLQLAAKDSLLVIQTDETLLEREEKEKAQKELKKKNFWGKVKTTGIVILGIAVVVLSATGG